MSADNPELDKWNELIAGRLNPDDRPPITVLAGPRGPTGIIYAGMDVSDGEDENIVEMRTGDGKYVRFKNDPLSHVEFLQMRRGEQIPQRFYDLLDYLREIGRTNRDPRFDVESTARVVDKEQEEGQ